MLCLTRQNVHAIDLLAVEDGVPRSLLGEWSQVLSDECCLKYVELKVVPCIVISQ